LLGGATPGRAFYGFCLWITKFIANLFPLLASSNCPINCQLHTTSILSIKNVSSMK
jgi:hypothetical protein